MRIFQTLCGGAALAVATIATPAQAAYQLSYDVTTRYAVSNIASFHMSANSGGIVNSYQAPVGTSTLVDFFPKPELPLTSFLLGVAYDLPGDAAGQKHLVVFANLDWSSSAQGLAFGTLFPTALEANIIQALENIGGASVDPAVIDASYEALGAFDEGDIRNGPNGPVAFTAGAAFALVAFSDGQIIGEGQSHVTRTAPVPEPSSWALMIGGFGLMGAGLRRTRRTAPLQVA